MKQVSTSNSYALLPFLFALIVCTVLHSPVIEAQQKMYWTDLGTDKIQRADLSGSNVEDLVTTGVTEPMGIALDLTNSKMYWTDIGIINKIQRADLDGGNVEDLVTTGLGGLRGIALDLTNRKMYWTDIATGQIQRADLDGSNVEDLVTTRLANPIGIALDLTNRKMYWTNIGTDKIQRADLDGSNVEDLVTGLGDPHGIALDVSDIPPPIVSIDITASPNPTEVGGPLDISLDLENPGDGFDAKFRLWVLADGNVTTLVSLSPFIFSGLTLTDFSVFSTFNVPTGLPNVVGFLAAVFDAGSRDLLDSDTEFVGIGVAPSAADITALRQAATDFLNSGDVNAAPVRPTQELNLNGTAKNPFEPQVSAKEKLTTTWGRIKSQR